MADVQAIARDLLSRDEAPRRAARDRLLALGPVAIRPLIEVASRADEPLLDAVRQLLPQFGPDTIDDFYWAWELTYLQREFVQQEAVRAVAAMGPAVLPRIQQFLGMEGKRTFALWVLREQRAVDDLVRLLNHPQHQVRFGAAGILAVLAEPSSAEPLLSALKSDDAGVRMEAARGLGRLRERRARPQLVGLLNDPYWQVRSAAVGALSNLYDRELRIPLASIARADPWIGTRNTAATNLIDQVADPVVVRLGRRYRPINIDPAATEALQLLWGLWFAGTGGLLWLAAGWAARPDGPRERRGSLARSGWLSLSVGALLGYYWGWAATGLSATTEYLLLLVVVPAAALLACSGSNLRWLLGPAIGATLALALGYATRFVGFGAVYLWLMFAAPWVLVIAVAVTLAQAGWLLAQPSTRSLAKARIVPTLRVVCGFYFVYGVSWLALWGRFGF